MFAWQTLYATYARKTLARTIRLYREAVNPRQSRSINDLLTDIAKWEAHVRTVDKEEQPIPEMIELAAFTDICATDIRGMI